MSKDIRSYFSILSTKSSNSTKPPSSTKKRNKALVSSDEDIVPETPVQPKKKETLFKKRKINVLSSDSEDEPKHFQNQKSNRQKVSDPKQKLKPVKASDIFGNEPIKQSKVPVHAKPSSVPDKIEKKKSKSKSKKLLEKEKFEDTKFQETLLDLDDDFLSENMDKLDETIREAESEFCKKGDDTTSSVVQKNKNDLQVAQLPMKNEKIVPIKIEEIQKEQITVGPTKSQHNGINKGYTDLSHNEDVKTPSSKRKMDDYDPDEDINRYEKKRHSAILYQKYLNRSGPAHHGTKDIPQGKPDCLKNICFIRTGVLDSLDNDDFESLVKNHGGKVVHSVSKKVKYVVAGEDPGPAKIEKARSYGISVITEDDLLDLIRTKSGLKVDKPKEVNSLDDLIDGLNHEENKHAVSSKTNNQTPIKLDSNSHAIDDTESSTSKYFSDKKTPQVKTSTAISDSHKLNGESSAKFNVKDVCKQESNSVSKTNNLPHSSVNAIKEPKSIQPEINQPHDHMPWTEKYKPSNVKSIIGQQGDKSNMKRLLTWLQNWFKNHSGKNRPKLIKPTPWAKSVDGGYFKAALLSGPPGIGKTTTAHLVSKELGFDVVEFNASDTRSKRLLQEELSQLLSSKSLAGFFTDGASPTNRHVLLMDEVDGMAGNEDRGGMQELINLIKNSQIPIICMCNDKNHTKMRSLVNYCFDLQFSRPKVEQIKGAMMSVCFKEGIDITPNALNEVIVGAGMDIRQILTNLSVWSASDKTLTAETATKEAKSAIKDTPLGQWEVCRKVFSESEHKSMSIMDRARLFYHDYSLAPLFVQENYLKVVPHAPKEEFLKRFSAAAESISMGDLIDKQIRTSNNWSLLDVQSMCASVIPGHHLSGHIGGHIDFPSWLGKNSKKNKFNRLLSEIQSHMRTSISGSRSAVNLDYVTHLRNNIAKPLINDGAAGINSAINVMHSYNLLREDFDGIIELSQWPKQRDPMSMVETKVKTAFTKTYNKGTVLPYSVQTTAIKKRAVTKQNDEFDMDNYSDQELDSAPEDNDDITNDAMIKAKKTTKKSSKKVAEPKPSSSKGGAAGGTGSRSRKKK